MEVEEVSSSLNEDVILEEQIAPAAADVGAASLSTNRKVSTGSTAARNRKKSRRMTLTQSISSIQDDQNNNNNNNQNEVNNKPEDDRLSLATSAQSEVIPERKISRIYSMLQSIQATFIHQQHHHQSNNPPTLPPHQPLVESPSIGRQQLLAMGQSQESLLLFPASNPAIPRLKNPVMDRLNRFGSINSWAGSECSDVSSTTTTSLSPPPPLIHAVPYHKDGWTSLFIVGSSTYAQLLIVVCIVSALSEVVTHNVPFLFFEGFFTYLYSVSILFFLYVFGYLLRSKRRKEAKRRQRKMSKWARAAAVAQQQQLQKSADAASSSTSVVMDLDDDGVVVTPSAHNNRFISSFKNSFSRRRVSRELSGTVTPDHKGLQWTPSSLTLNVVDESAVSYAMSGANIIRGGRSVTMNRHQTGGVIKNRKMKVSDNEHSHGSFFLRAGAVAFGLGTMIYDGLEFGAFLEVPPESPCFALLRGLNPILHASFAFLQMYFIFVSARLNIHKFKVVARFGLMHCLATNVCVWVRTLVRESLKEINGHYHHYEKKHKALTKAALAAAAAASAASNNATTTIGNVTTTIVNSVESIIQQVLEDVASSSSPEESTIIDFMNETIMEALTSTSTEEPEMEHPQQSLWELTGNISCGRRIFLGDVIMDAAPFLYPFLIEYSLIGAAILYVLWAHIGLNPKYKEENQAQDQGALTQHSKAHQLRVDCMGASKGLFFGLFFLTVSLLSLVLFFVFAPQHELRRLGLFLADAAHCTLLLVSLIAMAIGAYRARELQFHSDHQEELGNILLRVSAIGIYAYSLFSMIAGALTPPTTEEPPLLVLINGLLSLVEVTAQMIFISDMSRRKVSNNEQDSTKPGRQTVTFLLISNLTLWLVYTFEMQKVEANPVQVNFYGFLPWAIVQRITLPLCIFYRFHSAIVYAEIWKNTYRYTGAAASEHNHHAPLSQTFSSVSQRR